MDQLDPHYEIDRRDLSDRVYQVLRTQILSGKLAPGQRLSLDEFAQYFKVSITPVRDALRQLSSDGLVELQPRRGAFVTQPTWSHVEEVYQIREILECAAVEFVIRRGGEALREMEQLVEEIIGTTVGEVHSDYLAYIRLDQRFHQFLIDCVGNKKLSEIYAGLRSHTLVTLALYSSADQRATDTLSEHEAILDALRRGDVVAAQSALRTHLRNAKAEIERKVVEGKLPVNGTHSTPRL
ncbi:MAG TPA: GntR family transcriptional regulator [Chloroflexota bacterium]|nr:GntR family transcriptional regulator [Chloroflexota bacterium]